MTRKEMQDLLIDMVAAMDNGSFSAREQGLVDASWKKVVKGINELLDEIDTLKEVTK